MARHIIMTDEETESVLQAAQDCADSECSIDEVDNLLQVLKSTEKDLEERLEKVVNMIGYLEHINQKEERQTDEVREFVKDMLRVFNTGVSRCIHSQCNFCIIVLIWKSSFTTSSLSFVAKT